MKYVDDAAMDAVVKNDDALQQTIRGERILLPLPGSTSMAGAQTCMSFGVICTTVAVLFLGPLDIAHFERTVLFGLLPLVAIVITLSQTVLRGWRQGRRNTYRFAVSLALASLGILVASLVLRNDQRQWKAAITLSVLGVIFSVLSERLVAGTGYALASAVFRAKRAHAPATSRSSRSSRRSGYK